MEQKAFHENKPLSCSSTLCVWSLSGRRHSKDGHLVMSTRGTLTSFTLRRPAHNTFMFQDLHALYRIPWISPHTSYRSLHHKHTQTNTPHNVSPQPPSLSIVISACGPHTPHDVGICVTKHLFFVQYSFTSVQEQKWKNGKNHSVIPFL